MIEQFMALDIFVVKIVLFQKIGQILKLDQRSFYIAHYEIILNLHRIIRQPSGHIFTDPSAKALAV